MPKVYVQIKGEKYKTDDSNVVKMTGRGWSIKDKTKLMPIAKKKTTKRAVKIQKDSEIIAALEERMKSKNNVENPIKNLEAFRSEIQRAKIPEYLDEIGIDNDPGIDVPLHARGGHFTWNFEEKRAMPWYDKVTWVLTAVNVAIFITLLIKNLN